MTPKDANRAGDEGKIPKVEENGDVRWSKKGYGFKNKNGTLSLIRCPECGNENYAMNVLSGKCTWCPFDANKKS